MPVMTDSRKYKNKTPDVTTAFDCSKQINTAVSTYKLLKQEQEQLQQTVETIHSSRTAGHSVNPYHKTVYDQNLLKILY